MREACACGAALRTMSPKRLTEWRTAHPCTIRTPKPKPAPVEPDKSGSTSTIERAYRSREVSAERVPITVARIGFTPNDEARP